MLYSLNRKTSFEISANTSSKSAGDSAIICQMIVFTTNTEQLLYQCFECLRQETVQTKSTYKFLQKYQGD